MNWVKITYLIIVLSAYIMSLAVVIPITLIGKDPEVPPYTILMDVFIYTELVGGSILAFGLYVMRRTRKRDGQS